MNGKDSEICARAGLAAGQAPAPGAGQEGDEHPPLKSPDHQGLCPVDQKVHSSPYEDPHRRVAQEPPPAEHSRGRTGAIGG